MSDVPAAALSPSTTLEELDMLLSSPHVETRRAAAASPVLLFDGDGASSLVAAHAEWMVTDGAEPSTAGPAALRSAARGFFPATFVAALNPATPADALEALAVHADEYWVRAAVAANPAATADVLDRLAGGETNNTILSAIAAHPNCSPSALRNLAHVGCHEHASTVLGAVLANTNSPSVALVTALGGLLDEARSLISLTAALAGRRDLPDDFDGWGRLAASPHEEVRRAVAANATAPEAIIGGLERDVRPAVRQAATRTSRDNATPGVGVDL